MLRGRVVHGTRRPAQVMSTTSPAWPPLPLAEWNDTRDTLHMWTQIVGKTRLALAPMVNHWWQVTLYVTARGLTTSAMPYGTARLRGGVRLHRSRARDPRRATARAWSCRSRRARSRTSTRRTWPALRSLGIDVRIWPVPVEIATPIPFAEDRDARVVRCRAPRTLLAGPRRRPTACSRSFRGRFLGKASPVHFFWGSFDLACTRFSGARAPPASGRRSGLARLRDARGLLARRASARAGGLGRRPVDEPAFYAYAYPEPAGCPTRHDPPDAGAYLST